jgi:hypothetical protein
LSCNHTDNKKLSFGSHLAFLFLSPKACRGGGGDPGGGELEVLWAERMD